jgi:hypothetical protein
MDEEATTVIKVSQIEMSAADGEAEQWHLDREAEQQ